MTKVHSSLGFLFTHDLKQVALIEKKKPTFHAGKLNGLGGKSEAGETPRQCLVREVQEETGVITNEHDWVEMGVLTWDVWHVEIFAMTLYSDRPTLQNVGNELVDWYEVDHLPAHVLTNVPWLIPMCVDKIKNQSGFSVSIHYA